MNVFDFSVLDIGGREVELASFRGQVLLVVNTASACGFTPQYAALETLYRDYADRGLAVLGFPCNQFGKQEPGANAEIGAFCEREYAITFPMFAKIEVNGGNAHPLYAHLKQAAPGVLGTRSIKWNFTKFLVGRDGTVFRRYAPNTPPLDLANDIEALLAA
ncbi:MAG: glutathione peroxidase [Gammaproteobacteria bacterium]